jgi:hypothetical protein
MEGEQAFDSNSFKQQPSTSCEVEQYMPTAASDRELLVRIDERVFAMDRRLKVGDRRLNDHAKRIGTLEGWGKWLMGSAATLGLVFGILKLVMM